ncbi:MAG TPA: class I mannose-6-phosphate isomerase [Allosphingosinicella sp.]|nr:class I mannose-6-phosphate isomerase [Allosphingosinicella sp.]
MPASRLESRLVPKVWGRWDVPERFGPPGTGNEPLGEVWFPDDAGDEAELLVKYLFTSDRLSIQVHPDGAAARAAGHKRGKDEAWLVLRAEPDAVIGLGLIEPVSKEALRAAALDGSIEQLVDWRHVGAGDVFYSPAGTIHALGPGLTLVEIQQNLDVTYRLYDYGRPRELHLDEAVAAADPAPYRWRFTPGPLGQGRELLAVGAFVLERWRGFEQPIGTDGDTPVWLIPLSGNAVADGAPLEAGSVWVSRGRTRITVPEEAELLVAYAGGEVRFGAVQR